MVAAALFLASMAVSAGPELPASYPGQDVEHWFEVVSGLSGGGLGAIDGQRFSFVVDLEEGANFSLDVDAKGGKAILLYRMAPNTVAESWNRPPEAEPARSEFDPFKFLPLKSVVEEKAPGTVEFEPGKPVEVRNLWRYDYFLAFDNLKNFDPAPDGDETALRAEFHVGATTPKREGIRMLVLCRLKPPYFTQSEKLWKASAAQPATLTVQKRYLTGELLEVKFYDYQSGDVLTRITSARK